MDERETRDRDSRGKIERLLRNVRTELDNSIEPIVLPGLNAFERKLVHRHFDHNPNVVTKTYRDGEDFELRIYPVGNLRKFAQEKAEETIKTGQKVDLPPMSSYERFVIHDALKDMEAITANSYGEDDDRHVVLEPKAFGRGLRRIIKKIRLF